MAPPFLSDSAFEGQIQVILGPMFSGKSTELLRRVRRYQVASYECLLIKYENDVRYDKDAISTHDKQTLAAASTGKLYDVEGVEGKEVIGIDEGQFFPDLVKFCEEMANKGKIVIVAALDGTFQKQAFGDVLNLIPLAESVVKLNAVCMQCFKDAAFSKRITSDTQVEVIGGADKYLAVCRTCFQSPSKTPSPRKPLQQASPQRITRTNLSAKLDDC